MIAVDCNTCGLSYDVGSVPRSCPHCALARTHRALEPAEDAQRALVRRHILQRHKASRADAIRRAWFQSLTLGARTLAADVRSAA